MMNQNEVEEKTGMTPNSKFEDALFEACKTYLDTDALDLYYYVNVTLDEMWTGKIYASEDGIPFYYEIPAMDTKRRKRYIVSI